MTTLSIRKFLESDDRTARSGGAETQSQSRKASTRLAIALIAIFVGLLLIAKALHLKYLISTGLKGEFGPATAQWKAEVTQQALRSQQLRDAVVFFGDSLTVGLATSNVATRSENFGIDGDSIDWLLLRLPRYDLTGAKAIVLEIGINNWLQEGHSGFDGFADKYRTLLSRLPQSMPIVAVAILPVNSHAAALIKGHRLLGDIRQANHQIGDQCRQFSNCRYLDSSNLLADQSGNLKSKYDSGDGVHLSTAGYAAWSASLTPLFRTD